MSRVSGLNGVFGDGVHRILQHRRVNKELHFGLVYQILK